MKVFAIIDTSTNNYWSRNRWATPTSIPDLFKTRKAADYQVSGDGKCNHINRWIPSIQPKIVEMRLIKLRRS